MIPQNNPFILTTSNTQNTCGVGNFIFTVADISKFVPNLQVQIWSAQDSSNEMFGTVTQVSANNITVAVTTAYGTITDTNWFVQIISQGPLSGVNPSSAVSVDNTTTLDGYSPFPVQGNTITFQLEPNKAFSNYSSVYVSSASDYTAWFIATVLSYDPIGGVANVFVTLASTVSSTLTGPWVVSLMSSTAIDADLTTYASDTLTPTVGSQITFTTVQSGKYFPIQGVVLIDDLTSTQNPSGTDNHYTGTIVAYTGNTLIINITSAFGTGATSSSWGIYLVSGPQVSNIDLYQMNGLEIAVGINDFTVNAGSILDSTGSIVLTLASATSVSILSGSSSAISVVGPGTVSSSFAAVTGTGTTFTSTFSSAATLTDLNNQLTALNLSTISFPTVITANSVTASTITITNDLSLTTDGYLIAGGVSYSRGGLGTVSGGLNPHANVVYGIGLAYNSSSGAVSVFMTSFTPSGIPDLPSGCTYYRIIGYIVINNQVITVIAQPLQNNVLTTAGDMSYFGDVTYFSNTYATYLQRLPIGSSNQVLQSTGTLPNWSSLGVLATASTPLSTSLGGTGISTTPLTVAIGGTGVSSFGYGISNGAAISLSTASNVTASNIGFTAGASYFDGPSMAQGTAGTWNVSGTITVNPSSAGALNFKLWDGTTVISSTRIGSGNVNAANPIPCTLSGFLASPSGNIRISVNSPSSAGQIVSNSSGASKDSSIYGVRIA